MHKDSRTMKLKPFPGSNFSEKIFQITRGSNYLIKEMRFSPHNIYHSGHECPVPTRDDFRVKPNLDPYTEPQMLPECRPVTKSRRVAYNVTYENDGLLPKPTQQAMPGCDVFLEAKECNMNR